MRDPARQEQRHICLVEIERIERGVGKPAAHVVQRHHHHDDSAEKVHRFQARAHGDLLRRGDGFCNERHRETRRVLQSLIFAATCATSLSPRPERFTMTSWSFVIFGARTTTSAMAWADSSAGMM